MKPHRDQRLTGFLITISAVGILGALITLLPEPQPQQVVLAKAATIADGRNNPSQHADDARGQEIDMRFKQAIAMLHAKQHDYAVKALHRVLALAPKLVEAHVNMGYALLGLEDYKTAYDFFQSATALKPGQVNAYYGMAVALEGMEDLEGALGAMRTYIHLSGKDDPFLAKARAALWVWEDKLAKERETIPQETTEAAAKQHG